MALTPEQLLAKFDELGIETETHEHAPVFTVAESKRLRGAVADIWEETQSEVVYEGRIGASPREMKTLILQGIACQKWISSAKLTKQGSFTVFMKGCGCCCLC